MLKKSLAGQPLEKSLIVLMKQSERSKTGITTFTTLVNQCPIGKILITRLVSRRESRIATKENKKLSLQLEVDDTALELEVVVLAAQAVAHKIALFARRGQSTHQKTVGS